MYGTVDEIITFLRKTCEPDEKIALIVWTAEDVRKVTDDMQPTLEEIDHTLRQISHDPDVHEYGITEKYVRDWVDDTRREERAKRMVTISALTLENVLVLASDFLKVTDIARGEGQVAKKYSAEYEAVRTLRKALEQ